MSMKLYNPQRRHHCESNTSHIVENITHHGFIGIIPTHGIRNSAILNSIVQDISILRTEDRQSKSCIYSNWYLPLKNHTNAIIVNYSCQYCCVAWTTSNTFSILVLFETICFKSKRFSIDLHTLNETFGSSRWR